jgi:hypothetical protein
MSTSDKRDFRSHFEGVERGELGECREELGRAQEHHCKDTSIFPFVNI